MKRTLLFLAFLTPLSVMAQWNEISGSEGLSYSGLNEFSQNSALFKFDTNENEYTVRTVTANCDVKHLYYSKGLVFDKQDTFLISQKPPSFILLGKDNNPTSAKIYDILCKKQ